MNKTQVQQVVNHLVSLINSIPPGQDELNMVFAWGDLRVQIRCYKNLGGEDKYLLAVKRGNQTPRRAYDLGLASVAGKLKASLLASTN